MGDSVTPPSDVAVVDLDFWDSELIVREWSDGRFTLHVNGEVVVLSAEDMQRVVEAFARVGRAKGWTAEAVGS
jgi:hypothetical protein